MNFAEMLVPTLSLAELAARGSITFLLLYALVRLIGRREQGAVGLTDVLVIVLVADAASTGMVGHSRSIGDAFVLVVVILFWSVAIDALSYRLPWFARLAKAGPRPLIEDGQLVRSTMRREFMTHEEVMTQLRLHGIGDLSAVKHAYLEPNGGISVVTMEEAESEQDQGRRRPA